MFCRVFGSILFSIHYIITTALLSILKIKIIFFNYKRFIINFYLTKTDHDNKCKNIIQVFYYIFSDF